METERNKVLIIEDDLETGKHLRRLLERLGYDHILVITGTYGTLAPEAILKGKGFDPSGQPLDIDLRTVAVAFVDGILEEDSPRGWEIVPALLEARVTCIAISGSNQDDLVAAGAQYACNKSEIAKIVKSQFRQIYARAIEQAR